MKGDIKMATMFNTQTGEGKFKLQFETDDLTCYRVMQELARLCVDRIGRAHV